jgi:hypothetical protein
MEDTASVKLIDREGVAEILELLDGVDEDSQTAQNLLLVTCLVAQGLGIKYESFIQLVSKSWPLAGDFVGNN